jgi:ArsR family transcriptional regulator
MKDDINRQPGFDPAPEFDPAAMRAAAGRAGGLLKALANPDRLLLLCQLTQGEQRVGELESVLDLHQPSLSQQLGVLRQEGLVNTRREGKQIYYSIASEEALAVLQVLYRLYCPQEGSR